MTGSLMARCSSFHPSVRRSHSLAQPRFDVLRCQTRAARPTPERRRQVLVELLLVAAARSRSALSATNEPLPCRVTMTPSRSSSR